MNIKSNIIKLTTAFALLGLNSNTMAQDAASKPATESSLANPLEIALIVTAIVLLFVLWGMGQALVAISKVVRDKQKQSTAAMIILLLLSFFGQSLFAQTATAATTDAVATATSYGGLSYTSFLSLVAVIGTEILAIVFLSIVIKRMYEELMPEEAKKKTTFSKLTIWWSNMDKKIFTKAIPVEKEADVLLDHDYDGIRELDNALPPWWKYGFYFTIVVGFIYLLNFHVFGTGMNPTEEYNAEMEKAKVQIEQYEAMNKDKIDENNVPMADATGITAGNEIFHQPGMCLSCHGANGEGGAGPNLTDEYWIHKGSLNDIYKSIKTGYPDKGMQSWEKTFTPKQISHLASYIKSIRGTNPANAQPPKGELWIEAGTDTTKKAMSDAVTGK